MVSYNNHIWCSLPIEGREGEKRALRNVLKIKTRYEIKIVTKKQGPIGCPAAIQTLDTGKLLPHDGNYSGPLPSGVLSYLQRSIPLVGGLNFLL